MELYDPYNESSDDDEGVMAVEPPNTSEEVEKVVNAEIVQDDVIERAPRRGNAGELYWEYDDQVKTHESLAIISQGSCSSSQGTVADGNGNPESSDPLDEIIWPKIIDSNRQHDDGLCLPLVLDKERKIQVCASVNRYLREYQRQGVQFMYKHISKGKGCILHDDMGLGKTVQVCALLGALFSKTGTKRDKGSNWKRQNEIIKEYDHELKENKQSDDFCFALPQLVGWKSKKWPFTVLIVCPTSVLEQWIEELNTWGYFDILKFHGGIKSDEKENMIKDCSRGIPEIVITTYQSACDEFCELPWGCIIMDEVHQVKSSSTSLYKKMNRFKCSKKVGLTGTVVQNKLEELHALVSLVRPKCIVKLATFRSLYIDPIKNGMKKNASEDTKAKMYKVVPQLRKILRRVILRRDKNMKSIREQLPKKFVFDAFIRMTPFQEQIYKKLLNLPEVSLLKEASDICTCGTTTSKKGRCCFRTIDRDTLVHRKDEECEKCPNCLFFPILHTLAKVASHPKMLLDENDPRRVELIRKTLGVELFDKLKSDDDFLDANSSQLSGKFCKLGEQLSEWVPNGDRVLVFSQTVRTIDFLEDFCKKNSYTFGRYDGSMTVPKRQEVIKNFKTDPSISILLVSIRAGGTGLNLTSANKVVIFDKMWNPTFGQQAQDRAFRMGQKRDVSVYNYMSRSSIEEFIHRRQLYKINLSKLMEADQGSGLSCLDERAKLMLTWQDAPNIDEAVEVREELEKTNDGNDRELLKLIDLTVDETNTLDDSDSEYSSTEDEDDEVCPAEKPVGRVSPSEELSGDEDGDDEDTVQTPVTRDSLITPSSHTEPSRKRWLPSPRTTNTRLVPPEPCPKRSESPSGVSSPGVPLSASDRATSQTSSVLPKKKKKKRRKFFLD